MFREKVPPAGMIWPSRIDAARCRLVTRGSQQAWGVEKLLTSSRMRIRWASAVLRSGAIVRSATRTDAAAGRRSMRRAIASASMRRPSLDGVTDTRDPEIANEAETGDRTTPAKAGATASPIALRSRRTSIWPPSGVKRSAPSSCCRLITALRPAPRTATGPFARLAARP